MSAHKGLIAVTKMLCVLTLGVGTRVSVEQASLEMDSTVKVGA